MFFSIPDACRFNLETRTARALPRLDYTVLKRKMMLGLSKINVIVKLIFRRGLVSINKNAGKADQNIFLCSDLPDY